MLPLLVALATGTSPVLLKDLAPSAAVDSERYLEVDTGADPNVLVIDTPFWGAELFTVLDGKRSLVADLCPGRCGSHPSQLTRVNGKVVFLTGLTAPFALWATDGTAAGTVKLADDVQAAPRLTPLEAQLLFNRRDGIWVTDGTREGTGRVAWGKDRTLTASQPTALHRFIATQRADGGCDLFSSGTDVRNAIALPMPAPTEACGAIATLGERAYLSFTNGVWRFETTGVPVPIDAQGRAPVRAGDGLFFFGAGATTLDLFRSAGEPGTTVALGTVPATALRQAIAVGPRLIYAVVDGSGIQHLHASDGTPAGTVELGTVNAVLALIGVGPVAYAVVQNGTVRELVETDGTKSGTVVLQGVHPAAPEPGHSIATGHALALAFIGTVVTETGVFRLRPGEEAETVFARPANPRDSAVSPMRVVGRQAFFTDRGVVYQTDGTPDGSVPIADGGLVGFVRDRLLIDDGASVTAFTFDGGAPQVLGASDQPVSANFGATAVFSRGTAPAVLSVTNGTAAGTRPLVTLGNGTVGPPVHLDDGRAVFLVSPGPRLWFTDGTPEGSASVPVSSACSLAAGTDAVWVDDCAGGVWRVSPAQTARVHSGPAQARFLTPLDGALYFAVGGELWRTDDAGTALLGGLASIRAIAVHRGRVMVLGGNQLFEWDGMRLALRGPAPAATFLVSAGVHLYADVASLTEGQELHYWHDAFGLFLSTGDLSPGPGSSAPSAPVALGPRVLFTAWTPETGREPFAWDVPEPLPEPARGCGCQSGPGAGLLLAAAFAFRRRRPAVT